VEFKCHKKDGSVKMGLCIHSLYLTYQKEKALVTGVQQTTLHESGSKKLKNTESLYSDRHKMEGSKEI